MKSVMKMFFAVVLVVLVLAGITARALEDIPIPADFYDGATRKAQVDAIDVRVTAVEAMGSPGVAAVTVTNTAVLAVSKAVMLVTPSEVASVTIANPAAAGQFVTIVNVGTNTLTFTRAANIALGAATRAVTGDGTLTLVAATATAWKEVSNSIGNAVE